jgi:hypothetical protein
MRSRREVMRTDAPCVEVGCSSSQLVHNTQRQRRRVRPPLAFGVHVGPFTPLAACTLAVGLDAERPSNMASAVHGKFSGCLFESPSESLHIN